MLLYLHWDSGSCLSSFHFGEPANTPPPPFSLHSHSQSSSFFPITHSAGIARMYFRKLFGLAQSRIKLRGYRRYNRWEEKTFAQMGKLPGHYSNEDPTTDSIGGLTSAQMEKLPGNYNNEDPFKIFATPHTDSIVCLERFFARRRSEHLPQLPLDAPIRAAVCPEPVTSITTLPNKLRVATRTVNDMDATVGLWIDFGSRFETERTSGFGKFIEQMIQRNNVELKQEIENIGGELVSHVSREKTFYYFKGCDTCVSQVLDLFANFLANPSFNSDRINEMKCTGIEEVEGQAGKDIFDHLHAAAFQFDPLHRPIAGSAENVKSITKEQLEDYITTNYTAPRVVVLAAGKFDHKKIVEMVKKKFTNLSHDPTTGYRFVAKSHPYFIGSDVRVIDDDIKLAQFAIGFKGAAASDRDSIVFMVMQNMLGSLSKQPADIEDHGYFGRAIGSYKGVERVMAFNINYRDIGLFGISAVAVPGCPLKDLAYYIMSTLRKLVCEVDEYDVYLAREKLKDDLEAINSPQVAEDVGHQILTYGRRIPDKVLYTEIDAVRKKDVEQLADPFFYQDMAIAAVGPVKTLPHYDWFNHWPYGFHIHDIYGRR